MDVFLRNLKKKGIQIRSFTKEALLSFPFFKNIHRNKLYSRLQHTNLQQRYEDKFDVTDCVSAGMIYKQVFPPQQPTPVKGSTTALFSHRKKKLYVC